MNDVCHWTIAEYIIDHFSSDFYYGRECCDRSVEYCDKETYCGHCGLRIELVKNELWTLMNERSGGGE